jgi:aminoglycoside phosphotransferase family enzyme
MTSTPLHGLRTDLGLAAKVAVLRNPATYPERPARVEAIETHMSWVFLAGHHAYKLKKPVRYDFLDFSTLALRQWNCGEEVRLNRRLAANVYLGTVALARDERGALRLGGDGEVVEWLVQMRRLPAGRMLDELIRRGDVPTAEIDRLGALLAGFYQGCPAVERSGAHYRAELDAALELNRRELEVTDSQLPRARIAALHDAQTRFLYRETALFDARAADGRIVEGHGDLRPEHICLETPPVIIDCLEFNRRYRIVDPADELAFLAMECERLGAAFVGERLFQVYEQTTHDRPPARLVTFYKVFRACLRARFAIGHVRELDKKDWPRWQERAEEYLRLAEGYGERLADS